MNCAFVGRVGSSFGDRSFVDYGIQERRKSGCLLGNVVGHGWKKVEWMRREEFVRPAMVLFVKRFSSGRKE
jgi:hypothetical protein